MAPSSVSNRVDSLLSESAERRAWILAASLLGKGKTSLPGFCLAYPHNQERTSQRRPTIVDWLGTCDKSKALLELDDPSVQLMHVWGQR